MKFNCFTIVLDGLPWIAMHLEQLQATNLDWHWVIVEGTACPTQDTSWVKGITPRLSLDGTTQYLRSIKDKRVKVIQRARWENKTSMCNAALAQFHSGLLLQIDCDECWKAEQFQGIHDFFEKHPQYGHARFWCRYYLGPDIISTSTDGYGNRATEWCRAWRYRLGQRFIKHEPPLLASPGTGADRNVTKAFGLVFDHYSWYLPEQVKMKCEYYGGNYSYERWLQLQTAEFPVRNLQSVLPWVGPNASADKITSGSPVLESGRGPNVGAIAAYIRSAGGVTRSRHPGVPQERYALSR